MGAAQCRGDFLTELQHLLDRERSTLEALRERDPVAIFENQVINAIIGADVV